MLLSICIPCYKRVDQLRNTLHSIFVDNKDVSWECYEVVITDNDPDCEDRIVFDEYSSYPNIRYIPTNCEGFMNSYHALKNGQGDLLKLHNSQNLIRSGFLNQIVEQATNNNEERPLIFHSNGFLGNYSIRSYSSFDDYMLNLSYWSSWSGGMTIWRKDFEKIQNININPLFPHSSVFFTQFDKSKFVIDDRIMYDVQRVSKRGGHNKFEAFSVHFPSLIENCFQEHLISATTKSVIYSRLYKEYIPTLLFNKYIARIETFDASGYKENCQKYFPKGAFVISWLCVCLVPFRMIKRRLFQFQKK